MKSYTDIEQSKKLAKILPIESADMRYGYIAPYDYSDRMYDGGYDEIPYPKDFLIKKIFSIIFITMILGEQQKTLKQITMMLLLMLAAKWF